MGNGFWILVLDKNLNPNTWIVTASDSSQPPLLTMPNHHDQVVMQLPIVLYPGQPGTARMILNTHTNLQEHASTYWVQHV